MNEILIGLILIIVLAFGSIAFAMWFGKGWDDYINRGMMSEEKWAERQAYRMASERYINEQIFGQNFTKTGVVLHDHTPPFATEREYGGK
jgi:hypothetical protein